MLALLCAAAAAAPAWAQQVSPSPSAALACMTPAAAERGVPVYPPEQLERQDGATVRVELLFDGPQAAPRLRRLDELFIDEPFVRAVRDHVQRLRVPCMPAGAEPVRVQQTYVFRPDDGRDVVALPPRDVESARRAAQRECLTRIAPPAFPEYPPAALRSDLQGSYLVRLRFASPTDPPEAGIVAGPEHRVLRRALLDFLPGYRLPCQQGEPVELDMNFVFRIEGGPRTLLKDMTLRQFVGLARDVPPARFDFHTMGCPFDLRVQHFQPFKPHVVGQLGEARPERLDFVEWLSQVALKLDEPTALAVLGNDFTVSVPCGTLDL
jgi:hypothetical protein